MVEALNKLINSIVVQSVLLILLTLAVGSVYAEQLLDPTRPADLLGVAHSGAVSSGPALQSVLISPQRRVAIISGKTVQLGGKFGNAQVVSITETEVVLRSGKNLQTLKLFPDVQKKRLTARGTSTRTDHRRQ